MLEGLWSGGYFGSPPLDGYRKSVCEPSGLCLSIATGETLLRHKHVESIAVGTPRGDGAVFGVLFAVGVSDPSFGRNF